MQVNHGDSWFSMVMSQIDSLTLDPSFGHNLCFLCPNGLCKPILDIFVLKVFQLYNELSNPTNFKPLKSPSKNLRIHWNSNSQSGSPLGSVWVHSSHSPTLLGVWNVTRASLLACTFASCCLRHEPKARVVTLYAQLITIQISSFYHHTLTSTPHKEHCYLYYMLTIE
jgi:hypothetical protein